jgi:hypothetical protein
VARQVATEALMALRRPELVDDVAIVVTELVANAVIHAHTDIELSVDPAGDGVRVAVSDGSHILPRWTPAASTATSGRGLILVQRLASVWGVDPHGAGKTVWALIERPTEVVEEASAEDLLARWAADEPAAPAPPSPALVQVVLTVEVAAMLDSRAHTEDLTRELQLIMLSEDSRPTAAPVVQLARRLAAATTAFDDGRQQILAQTLLAAQQGQRTVTLHLQLHPDAAEPARQWLAALDDADTLTAQGLLLLPPFAPAMVKFRRHYVDAIISALQRA